MKAHKMTVHVDDGDLYLGIECPFDAADQSRPCWPHREDGIPEAAPQPECVYASWVDNLASDELLSGEWSVTVDCDWEWNGSEPTVSLCPVDSAAMTHPAVQRARELAAHGDLVTPAEKMDWVEGVEEVLPELVKAYEAQEKQLGCEVNYFRTQSFDYIKENDRVMALNTRLTAALRNLLTVSFIGHYCDAPRFKKAEREARALLAETEKT